MSRRCAFPTLQADAPEQQEAGSKPSNATCKEGFFFCRWNFLLTLFVSTVTQKSWACSTKVARTEREIPVPSAKKRGKSNKSKPAPREVRRGRVSRVFVCAWLRLQDESDAASAASAPRTPPSGVWSSVEADDLRKR